MDRSGVDPQNARVRLIESTRELLKK